jgi:hypothetical protein
MNRSLAYRVSSKLRNEIVHHGKPILFVLSKLVALHGSTSLRHGPPLGTALFCVGVELHLLKKSGNE